MMKLSTRVAHERLTRICFIDYDREMALVADHKDPPTGEHNIVGVGRLTKLHGTSEAEFAILITDKWQGQGLGTELLQRLIKIGRDENVSRISADILPENQDMQKVCQKVGFQLQYSTEDQVVKAAIAL
jgi:acetyltransferase